MKKWHWLIVGVVVYEAAAYAYNQGYFGTPSFTMPLDGISYVLAQ